MIAQLLTTVIPPTDPLQVPSSRDWDRAEQHWGVTFPLDLKEILRWYGSGWFDAFLYVLNPAASLTEMDLLTYRTDLELTLEILKDRHPAIAPSPDEKLVPIAGTGNGDEFFYVANKEAQPWDVMIKAARASGFDRYSLPLSTLLTDLLSGNLRSTVFPDDFPSNAPLFKPLQRVQ